MTILRLAIPTPLRQHFDYLPAEGMAVAALKQGCRIQVPFGTRNVIGILLAVVAESDVDKSRLKPVHAVMDERPLLNEELNELIHFASRYYQYPLGEVYRVALPSLMQKGRPLAPLETVFFQLTDEGSKVKLRGSRQQAVVDYIRQHGRLDKADVKALGFTVEALRALERKALLYRVAEPLKPESVAFHPAPFTPDPQQQVCIDRFETLEKGYQPILLEGITGSGKTEVYLQLVERVLRQGKQALILVPEIGLTPQTLNRFSRRFGCEMAIFHSGLTDAQRLIFWQRAREGIAPVIIGTRSALFTPCKDLGLIIIDEEHDLSYKQQESLRYSARDLGCVRARINGIPIVLGSATPSLESLNNAEHGKFHHWYMGERAGESLKAEIHVQDIKRQPLSDGLADCLLPEITATLAREEQVLLFINRRGFAPALICHDCGWVQQCDACDAKLTIHRQIRKSLCHHCGAFERTPDKCPECFGSSLESQGTGTERLALRMQQLYPDIPCYRIDRDSTRGKETLETRLLEVQQQGAAILVGTQMLAKGHHLPNVTLVVVVDADAGLMGVDFRATERFGQLVTQVTGRAGRAEKPGKAIIQTHYPEHEQLLKLVHFGYRRFAMDILAERKRLQMPPFGQMALVRLEAKDAAEAMQILQQLAQQLHHFQGQVFGPFAAGLARRAHYYRFVLSLRAGSRGLLQAMVAQALSASDALIKPRHRFSVDIDPQDMA